MPRQLTAIMFTELVGYADLMEASEPDAVRLRDRHHEAVARLVPVNDGRTVELFGEGTLSAFRSAVDACRCALQLQRELGGEDALPLRVGIHCGDVVDEGEGVFGDGVNVASRIQGLAVPGSVLISSKVYDEVRNQPSLRARSLGRFHLKNVSHPMEVYALCNPGLVVPAAAGLAPSAAREGHSVAVLPFVNMSADPANEFFSDGVTEEIIGALTRVNGLQVTARTSSFAFKDRSGDVREIAAQLGVRHLLEGSVRKVGDRVRIAAQLIDASDGYHLFSEVYDRRLTDIFETQDEIARAIVERLESSLLPRVPEGSEPRRRLQDPAAYTLYLQGLAHWNRWTEKGAQLAIEHYRRAISVDPECALPYSAMAGAYTFLGVKGWMRPREAFPRARTAARRALELEELGECHTALAGVECFYEWDFDAAYRHFQTALSLTPGSVDAHHFYGLYLKAVGEMEAAVQELEAAVRLDPLSAPVLRSLGSVYHAAGRSDDALAQLERSLELAPDFGAALETLGWVHVACGEWDQALAAFEAMADAEGVPTAGQAERGFAYARMGREDQAREIVERLEGRAEQERDHLPHLELAVLHLGLQDLDAVFEHLDRAVDERLGDVVFLATSPDWREIRHDPRFEALRERIGLADVAGAP